jgi:hypothetical protein
MRLATGAEIGRSISIDPHDLQRLNGTLQAP